MKATYWTGVWAPEREAISQEVVWLRGALAPGSPVVAFTPQRSGLLARDRVVRVNAHRWLGLRLAGAMLERAGDVTHVFGGIDASHFLHVLGRRPILFTVVIAAPVLEAAAYDRVAMFAAESRELADALVAGGIARSRIEVIYPAVDVTRFQVAAPPAGPRFRLLFASSPWNAAEVESRAIGLLIELARVRPDVDVVVTWRDWGESAAALREIESRQPPANFRIARGVVSMAEMYAGAHAVVCSFERGLGKSAPNSVVEGLAYGRPALVTDTCGIADLVGEWNAGVVTPRSVDGLAAGVDRLRADYAHARRRARALAEREFDRTVALERYAGLYRRLARQEAVGDAGAVERQSWV